MNRATLIFLGAFLALSFSWAGLLLSNVNSYGGLAPHFDETDNKAYPAQVPGLAAQGAQVYADLGCAYCHTQQISGGEPSADLTRKWGERESYARDYIREESVLLGELRVGPDLRNFGARDSTAAAIYLHLYNPQIETKGSTMPPYAFLFTTRKIVGQPSPLALDRVKVNVPAGSEIIPTDRAEALVAYLLNLRDSYEYPVEKQKNTPPKPPAAPHGAAEHKPEAHK